MADAKTPEAPVATGTPDVDEKVAEKPGPSETAPEQATPAQTSTDSAAAAETQAAPAEPAETPAPVDAPAPTETQSEDKPAEEKPAEEKPVADKPTEDKPTEDKPAEDKPTEDKPAEDKAAGETKAESKPAEPAGAAAGTTQEKEKEPEPTPKKTPLDQFDAKLPELLKEIGHDEMWGVKLVSPASSHVPTAVVLQKFLNANDGDLAKAVDQFKGALKFRKEKKPLELLGKTFSANKFADLGAVTVYTVKDSAIPEVFTWNLYGNVKGKMDEVFVPLEEFMNYRIALQELGIQQLKLSSATEPITAEKDPYKIIQVHDYRSISFLRQNPNVRAASTEVIKQFALAYPELLKEKFFVNVPAIMGWMYAVIKVFIAEKTAKKFHPMANGANLAAEFKTGGLDEKQLPKEYGGEGGSGDGKMKDIPGLINELKFD